MLTLSIQLEKKGKGYQASLIAEDGEKELHREDWGKVVLTNKLTRRLKVVSLGGKNLGICLNILNKSHDLPTGSKSRKSKTTKKKSGTK